MFDSLHISDLLKIYLLLMWVTHVLLAHWLSCLSSNNFAQEMFGPPLLSG